MAAKLTYYDSSDVEAVDQGPETLARTEGLGSVTVCDCGTLTVNIQALSLRMELKAFAQLSVLCTEAMEALERMARDREMEQLVSPSPLMH